ncbi:FkbM family methyltransferase [Salinimicrobium sp. 3283s]|uniref:FkbM family methyltransferase n=1 Tax=Salinimicrobium sp. 3283s TaxID=3114359 RepID=UPI0031E6BD8E
MTGKQRKLVNRIIAKVYHLTKSEKIRLALLNVNTKFFIDWNNNIEYDPTNKLFWLKNGKKYLLPVEKPYFDFNEKIIERRVLEIFCPKYIPKKGDVIINVGAGIGEELYFFQKKIEKKGRIYNIEASPSSFSKLEILCRKNNYLQCRNFNCAISNSNGEIWIEEGPDYLKNKINNNAKGIKIPCYSLDQFIADNSITYVDFLKVNIEGAEFQMIEGMKDSIDIIENIAISCHDFLLKNNRYEIIEKVKSFLIAHSFTVFQKSTGNEILDSWLFAKKTNGTI